ncbi:hypothetical protein CFter6_0500 [Collimonas fungivorans]|uniref:Uncharacterized protein n=1 Tax=Collimonas fungivorans TaxID=158899 RepID=A0A127P5X5_9BURK|nr:hypothetical protein CFter6_0500 [Collimonas fungivorans]
MKRIPAFSVFLDILHVAAYFSILECRPEGENHQIDFALLLYYGINVSFD